MVEQGTNTAVKLDVVQDYLDALLRDATVPLASPAQKVVVDTPLFVAESPSQLPTPVDADFLANSLTESDEGLALSHDIPPLYLVRQRPAWARHPFAALLFSVHGMTMAAPLHELGGICLLENRIQPVVGQAPWFMGLLRWNGRNLRVVDTARLLLSHQQLVDDNHEQYKSAIVLGDSLWALAISEASQSVRLDPDAVRWRDGGTSRPWLAGTVLESLSSLLDIDVLNRMLDSAGRQDDR